MTTPLKALIQERLRAKIVRQEVDDDDDDADNVDDLLLITDAYHHHHQEHHLRQHYHCDLELQPPSHVRGPVCGTGSIQRTLRQPQQFQENPSHGNQCLLTEDTSSVSHRHKSHHSHNQQQQHHRTQSQPHPQQHYSANQKLVDYYTYEHHQKFDGYFRQDRSFGRGFHDERYKTLGYEQEDESHRSPLMSPWRSRSASSQFGSQDPEDETHDEQEREEGSKLVSEVASPEYAPLPPQQQQHRSSSAELKHVRDRDSRVHPVDLHGFRNARPHSPSSSVGEPQQQKTEQLPHVRYDAHSNSRERHVYPRGHSESQLYEDGRHDTKQEDSVESHHEVTHQHKHHKQHRRHETHRGSTASLDRESSRRVLPRKRGFGAFEDPREVEDAIHRLKPRERLARRQYEYTVDASDNSNLMLSEEEEPERSYSHEHRFNHDRFGNSAFYVDNLVASPLAAASSLAPLVFAAATSPRLETKRSGSMGRTHRSQIETGMSASATYSAAPSLGTLPAPLDMAVIETTRRRDDLDAMPQASGANNSNSNSSSSIINRRSSSTLLRRLDAMLSPGCHRAATAFVEKRRRRAANSTPRTMATQRWLQSMDPSFRERSAAETTTACLSDQDQHQYQETPLALPALFSTARSASSCSSSSPASPCASAV